MLNGVGEKEAILVPLCKFTHLLHLIIRFLGRSVLGSELGFANVRALAFYFLGFLVRKWTWWQRVSL